MAKILEVKNLIISFRTNNGTVKAVRDIRRLSEWRDRLQVRSDQVDETPIMQAVSKPVFGFETVLS